MVCVPLYLFEIPKMATRLIRNYYVLVTILRTQIHRATHRVPRPGGGERETSRWGLLGYNTERLTSDQNGYGDLRVSSFLYVKDLFCRFRKRVGALE